MSTMTADGYPPHDRFLDEQAITRFLDKAKDDPRFQNAAWIEPGVGWGRIAIPVIKGLANNREQFGDKSKYYGFDKDGDCLNELEQRLAQHDKLIGHDFRNWDLTSKRRSAIKACQWSLAQHDNAVVILASFLSHVPNGLHLLRDKLLLPLLRARKNLCVILFQCEQNVLTSLIEGAILESGVRRFVSATGKQFYSPLLDSWLTFDADGCGAAPKTLFQLVDYLYCFKECGNLRRYSMVSPHKVTATDLTAVDHFLRYLGFEPVVGLCIYGRRGPTEPTPLIRERSWTPMVSEQPIGWTWVRRVFSDWVYAGIMDEGLAAPVRDPIGQLLALAIMARQTNKISTPDGLPNLKQLVSMYEARLGCDDAESLRSGVRRWLASGEAPTIGSGKWGAFLRWLVGQKDHPVVQTIRNRSRSTKGVSSTDDNRGLAINAIVDYCDSIPAVEKAAAAEYVSTFRTDLWCYNFPERVDLDFDFRDSLAFPLHRLDPERVGRALKSGCQEDLRDLLGSFSELSESRFPPKLLEPPREAAREEGFELESPILQNIATWLARGGLGDWLVMGYFNSRQFSAQTESNSPAWKIESGTLFPFTSITAHNTRTLSLAAGRKIKFSSMFFDDNLLRSDSTSNIPGRVRIQFLPLAKEKLPTASIQDDLTGNVLLMQIPRNEMGGEFSDGTLKEHWTGLEKALSTFSRFSEESAWEFLRALYQLQEYDDCWGKRWTHCYYYLERRLMRDQKLRSKVFSGLAIYSTRALTPKEEAWCAILSTQLVSEVTAPLLEVQELDLSTEAAKNFRNKVNVVVPKALELIKAVGEAYALSTEIERHITPGLASQWLNLAKRYRRSAFPNTPAFRYWDDDKEENLMLSEWKADLGKSLFARHDIGAQPGTEKDAWTQYSDYFRALGEHHQVRFLRDLPRDPPSESSGDAKEKWYAHAWMLLKILFWRTWEDPKSLYDAQILLTLRVSTPETVSVVWQVNGGEQYTFATASINFDAALPEVNPDLARFIGDAVKENRSKNRKLLDDSTDDVLQIGEVEIADMLTGLSRVCFSLSNPRPDSDDAVLKAAKVEISNQGCTVILTLDKAIRTAAQIQATRPGNPHSLGGGWVHVRDSTGPNGEAFFCKDESPCIRVTWLRGQAK